MTNYEKIKQMTKEELCLFLVEKMDCSTCDICECHTFRNCKKNLSKWLDSEAKDND